MGAKAFEGKEAAKPARVRSTRRAGARARTAQRGPSEAERRLEALHRQTGVLAHDFNNLLNVILAANEALAGQLPEGSDARELAQISLDAAEKGAELLARIADLSNPNAAAVDAVDCAEVLVGAARLANVSVAADVTVVAGAMREPLAVCCDRGALDSALLNLCLNAGHAMPRGGAIVISAAAALDVPGLPPGRYAALSVKDPGVGMSPQTLARCTDAYFTTRKGRGGTGLGLAGVNAFAQDAGGALRLVSLLGRGTTATIYLPVA